jgi:hypothetical protein
MAPCTPSKILLDSWTCFIYSNDSFQNSCRKHPSVYESIEDLRTEQHASLVFAEKAVAGSMKITKRAIYEEIDERLQALAANFHVYPRSEYFSRARALFNF